MQFQRNQRLVVRCRYNDGTCGYTHVDHCQGKFPKINKKVETTYGKGRVVRHNVLKETVIVRLENDEEMEITPKEIIAGPVQKEKKKRKG